MEGGGTYVPKISCLLQDGGHLKFYTSSRDMSKFLPLRAKKDPQSPQDVNYVTSLNGA